MIPKELDFLNNRTYDWFLNNSTLMTEDDFDKLKKTDMVLEMYKESFLKKRDLKPGPPVNVMWDFQDAKGSVGLYGGRLVYVCKKYSFIFDIQGNLLSPKSYFIPNSYFLKDWINTYNQGEEDRVWQFRKMNFPLPPVSFLNWHTENPFEVKQ